MLGATLVAPGHNHVVPLPPEFIVPQDGSNKQDCESRAARRWLAAHGAQYARLRPVYLGDDLFANQPMCEAIQAIGGNFVFTCKPASHALIGEYITGGNCPDSLASPTGAGDGSQVVGCAWLPAMPSSDMAVPESEVPIAGTVSPPGAFR
jgi:hypothetical protein